MLVRSLVAGLTQGRVVYKVGDIFKLDDHQLGDLEGKTDAQIESAQKKIYGRAVFKRVSIDDLHAAWKSKKVSMDMLSDEEQIAVHKLDGSSGEKQVRLNDELIAMAEARIAAKKAKGK